ncbi:cytochrome c [Hyphomicrobium sp. 99]|uniref:c-type cytochrome n=1 Tax=Hyphomicrobium sp. 99 TaxID=1163419 RepID=UPI0006990C42|nr:cytochrome c [Hyphomicrobium sp. 99]
MSGLKKWMRTLTFVAGAGTAMLGLLLTAGNATTPVPVPSGHELFVEYCSQCHGADGVGNGPTAKYLTVTPANLTEISKRANGQFPAARIAEIIRYGGDVASHGPQRMPLWGKVFSEKGGRGKGGGNYSRVAVIQLLKYLESIQKK